MMNIARYALSAAIAALLAGCGGSEPPIGTPGSMAQAVGFSHRASSATSGLLYVTNSSVAWVYSLPANKPVASFKVAGVDGMCADQSGDIFMLGAYEKVYEYHRGDSTPFTTLYDDYDPPRSCSVDPVSGNLAVANNGDQGSDLAIWTGAQGAPTFYTISAIANVDACAYDDNGNLFVVGSDTHNAITLIDLAYGSQSFVTIALHDPPRGQPNALQWSGSSLVLGMFEGHALYRIDVAGSSATMIKKVRINGLYRNQFQGWVISGSTLISATRPKSEDIAEYRWPKGGKPVEQFQVPTRNQLTAIAVSVAPRR